MPWTTTLKGAVLVFLKMRRPTNDDFDTLTNEHLREQTTIEWRLLTLRCLQLYLVIVKEKKTHTHVHNHSLSLFLSQSQSHFLSQTRDFFFLYSSSSVTASRFSRFCVGCRAPLGPLLPISQSVVVVVVVVVVVETLGGSVQTTICVGCTRLQ